MLSNLVQSNKKANDIHDGKWNGLGGKFEVGEVPEEAGLSIRTQKYCDLLIFTTAAFTGELFDSPESRLELIAVMYRKLLRAASARG